MKKLYNSQWVGRETNPLFPKLNIKNIRKNYKKDSVLPWISPAIIMLLLVTIIPTLFLFYLSLYNWELATPWDTRAFVGFKNFVDKLKEEQFINSLFVTLKYVFCTVIIEFFFGLFISVFIKGQTKKMKIFIIISLILPLAMTSSVVGLIFRSYFNPSGGIFNYFTNLLFNVKVNWFSKENALVAVIITDIWQWTPFITLILYSGLEVIPQEGYEAAVIDGASPLKILRYITIPLLKPIILIVLLLRTMDSLRMFDTAFVMTEGGPGNATELLSLHIYRTGFFHTGYLGLASAVAVILLIITTILSQVLIRGFSKEGER